MKFPIVLFVSFALVSRSFAQTLVLPPRSAAAKTGDEFAKSVQSLNLREREEKILSEIITGNSPEFLRHLCAVNVTNIVNGKTNLGTFFVTPDYLAVGSDTDFFLAPMTPFTAQKIADALGCTLPTRKMVNDIFSNAVVKLPPAPIPPTPLMITVPIFKQHNETVRQQRAGTLKRFPLGALSVGHKKDVVISSRLKNSPGKVAIYGWHRPNGFPIQPLYLGHAASWADYSHGVRLVQKKLIVNGEWKSIEEVLANPELAALLSDEGTVSQAKYIFPEFPHAPSAVNSIIATGTNKVITGQFVKSPHFNEQTMLLQFDHGVRVVINAPSPENFIPTKKNEVGFLWLTQREYHRTNHR